MQKPHYLWGLCMVQRAGLEPARPNGHQILSLTCLPIPPPRHGIHTRTSVQCLTTCGNHAKIEAVLVGPIYLWQITTIYSADR